MNIAARISLSLTILIFIALCINALYFCLALFTWGINIGADYFHPIIGALIPIVLLINMISLLHTCDYENNLVFFYRLTKNNKIKMAIYASMGLINPMLLYIHTKSYNCPIRIFGILRCFPIVNIFMYLKLIRSLKKKVYPEHYLINQYFKGMLILTLIKEEKS